ncbi:hypothetical protein EK21DRAFT_113390 [Setomelanomma holmii]|uniref:Uncharacterized protein n=1 Tax=Setomelanomma holmii TaxID=210430 RepID=A0A9P4H9C6_9PLEO|nr:hypothetical protein EK21DRAFT_113390 [Setomelanomma holmii]
MGELSWDHILPSGLVISRVVSTQQVEHWTPSLSSLVKSCVNDDPQASSIEFRAPLSHDAASAYWKSLSKDIAGPQPMVFLFALHDPQAEGQAIKRGAIGTIQLGSNPKATHIHKTEVRKLLIRSD